jgi:hypothetical protein
MYERERMYAIEDRAVKRVRIERCPKQIYPLGEVVMSLRESRPLAEVSSNVCNQVQGLAFEG